MSQGQWSRLSGRNPSHTRPGSVSLGHRHDLTHPVEQVSWQACMELMPRFGLALPSEAQWEYGARAGSSSAWWTGQKRDSLRTGKAANLADSAAARGNAIWKAIADWPELDDEYKVHAPVNSFAPNAFGLHNVHGNVWEWCLDGYESRYYAVSPPTDPLRAHADTTSSAFRGGSFFNEATFARSSARNDYAKANASFDLGLRPARRLEH